MEKKGRGVLKDCSDRFVKIPGKGMRGKVSTAWELSPEVRRVVIVVCGRGDQRKKFMQRD